MKNESISITLSEEKINELIKAYNLLGDLLETILPREKIYQKKFREGVEQALEEVETGKSQKIRNFDEFIE
jgi:DNA topoisomerase IA